MCWKVTFDVKKDTNMEKIFSYFILLLFTELSVSDAAQDKTSEWLKVGNVFFRQAVWGNGGL